MTESQDRHKLEGVFVILLHKEFFWVQSPRALLRCCDSREWHQQLEHAANMANGILCLICISCLSHFV